MATSAPVGGGGRPVGDDQALAGIVGRARIFRAIQNYSGIGPLDWPNMFAHDSSDTHGQFCYSERKATPEMLEWQRAGAVDCTSVDHPRPQLCSRRGQSQQNATDRLFYKKPFSFNYLGCVSGLFRNVFSCMLLRYNLTWSHEWSARSPIAA
jgi:hypothetical protein